MPFDFVGIFLKDLHVEMVETDEFAQLVSKNSCQFFWLPASRERLRDAKESFIAFGISSQRELWFWTHMLRALRDPPAILLKSLLQQTRMTRIGDRVLFFISATCQFKSTSFICLTSEHPCRSGRGGVRPTLVRSRRPQTILLV